jgi:hypothetical protein
MAFLGSHTGSWGLPDFGITEWIGSKLGTARSSSGGSNLSSYSSGGGYTPVKNYSTYRAPSYNVKGSVLGSYTGGSLSGGQPTGGGDRGGGGGGGNQGYQGPSEMDIINQEYDAFNSMADTQSATANTNYTNYVSNLGARGTSMQNELATNTANTVADIGTKQVEGRQNERLNLQKVRQLLSELDQRNAAQTAISGGGSVSEALAERFGRTAQQNVGGVLTSGQNLQNSLETEKVKANQFLTQKTQEIKDWVKEQTDNAWGTLQQNLGNISSAKLESASAKARATLDAWKGFYNDANNARIQAAQFKMQYDTWKMQFDASVGKYNPTEYNQPNYNQYMFDPSGRQVNVGNTGDNQVYQKIKNPYDPNQLPV